jgi:hypothetical protein
MASAAANPQFSSKVRLIVAILSSLPPRFSRPFENARTLGELLPRVSLAPHQMRRLRTKEKRSPAL